jgi:hypothetical protein
MNRATLTALTTIQAAQFSRYLRPSRYWPIRLTAVGKASHQGTSVSVQVLRNRPVAGHSRAQASRVYTRPLRVSRATCSAEPSARCPRSHWNQPHRATTTKKICSAASP